jgi:protein gp37
MARRLQAMGQIKYRRGFKVTTHPEVLNEPLKWKKSRMVFVCSMSDLFHKDVSDNFIFKIFDIMNKSQRHIFQILTKRVERMVKLSTSLNWTDNIWAGVTVESNKFVYRIRELAKIESSVRFLSLEPLLSNFTDLSLTNIDWVIVGGESGIGARPIEAEWVRNVQYNCIKSKVAFYFKQWGGKNKKKAGRLLDGRTWNEFPVGKVNELTLI